MQVDDGGFAAFYQAQFGDCMTQQCLEKLLANRLPTRIASLSGQSGDKLGSHLTLKALRCRPLL